MTQQVNSLPFIYSSTITFDSYLKASFTALLETVKKLGSHVEEPDVEEYEEAMAKEPSTLLREEMVAIFPYIISSPDDYKKCLRLNGGKGGLYAYDENTDGTSGMTIDSQMTVAVSKSTPYVQEAWDFILTLFEEENQLHFTEKLGGIPIRRSAVDTLCEKCSMTEQEKSAFAEELGKKHCARIVDDSVMDIVKEEAEGYFMGQKDVNSVVSTTQNRVATVLKERG